MNADSGRVSTRVFRTLRAESARRLRAKNAPLWGFGLLVALGLVGLAASPPDADAKATVQPFVGATTVSDVAERVSPSVVSITTEGARKAERGDLRGRRSPHDFFGPRSPFDMPPERRMMGVASGVVISADGYIVTNHHVVEGAGKIRARFVDGRELDAKLIGTDEATDLALLKVDAKNLPYLEMGDSTALRLGEIVLAVGNPFGVGETVTMGIVSAKGRSNIGIVDYEDFIQTDAAINPGNSGGALVNLEGKLVGINTAILSQSGGAAGIGFAVPSAMVRPILDQIRTTGTVTRGWLGVAIQDLTPELANAMKLKTPDGRGVVISDVLEGGPAAKAGLESGDVVLSLDGKQVTSSTSLRNAIAMMAPGSKAKLVVQRSGGQKEVVVTLAKKPAEETLAEADGGAAGGSALAGMEVAELTRELRGQLELPSKIRGVVVVALDPDSPAARAGLREGDVITAVDRTPVHSVAALAKISRAGDGDRLLRVWRGGSFMFVVVKAG